MKRFWRHVLVAVGGALALLGCSSAGAFAAGLTPDLTFGTDGVSTSAVLAGTGGEDHVGSIALRPTGGVLVFHSGPAVEPGAGRNFVEAFTESGVVDAGYATGGRAALPLDGHEALGAAIDGTGALYVLFDLAGDAASTRGMQVVRLLPDGQVDTGFGEGGVVGLKVRREGNVALTTIGQSLVVCGALRWGIAVQTVTPDGPAGAAGGRREGLTPISPELLTGCGAMRSVSGGARLLVGGSWSRPSSISTPERARVVGLTARGKLDVRFGRRGVVDVTTARRTTESVDVGTIAVDAGGLLLTGSRGFRARDGSQRNRGFVAPLSIDGRVRTKKFGFGGLGWAGRIFTSAARTDCLILGAGRKTRLFTALGRHGAGQHVPGPQVANAAVVLSDAKGKLWTAGAADTPTGYTLVVRRLQATGCPSPTPRPQ